MRGDAPGHVELFPGVYDFEFVDGATGKKGRNRLLVNPGEGVQIAKLQFDAPGGAGRWHAQSLH